MKPPSNDPTRMNPPGPGKADSPRTEQPNRSEPGKDLTKASAVPGAGGVPAPNTAGTAGSSATPKPAVAGPADAKGPDGKVPEVRASEAQGIEAKVADTKPAASAGSAGPVGTPKPAPSVTSPAAAGLGGKPVDPTKAQETPKPAETPKAAIASGAATGAGKAQAGENGPIKADAGRGEPGKAEPDKAEAFRTGQGKSEPSKPDGGKSEPPKPGGASGPQGALRSGPSGSDGPIIDLAAKRVPEAGAGTDTTKTRAETVRPDPAKSTDATPARGPGFGSVAAAGLLGGVIGAGLLFAVERAGIGSDKAADTQAAALDQRVATLAPRDALVALDKRVAANEAALKPLPEAVRGAEATAKQALDKAAAAPSVPAEGSAVAPAATLPPDLAARLDALDQRVSALQEEPGREQQADAKVGATQSGDAGQAGNEATAKVASQVSGLDERLKALEGKAEAAGAQPDFAAQIAALRSDLDTRAKAGAAAEQSLGQRVDGLQQALDQRVQAATEAVQSATQASREAAEAGRTQAQEATKAVERQIQDQKDQIAALGKAVAGRASAGALQAALRVVAAGRIAAALQAGAPYADALDGLRNQAPGEPAQLAALAPFAEKGAPTSEALAAAFKPVAERIGASRRAAQARSVAETGDIKQRFLSMATSIVQVRKVDAPAAPGSDGAPEADPTAKVQAALDRGDLQGAEQAFQAMPEDARAEAGDFGSRLKARMEAGRAADALLAEAFKALPSESGR